MSFVGVPLNGGDEIDCVGDELVENVAILKFEGCAAVGVLVDVGGWKGEGAGTSEPLEEVPNEVGVDGVNMESLAGATVVGPTDAKMLEVDFEVELG